MNIPLADIPAFPVPNTFHRGMTLRQHYAGLAMQGICADKGGPRFELADIAHWSVAVADALLDRDMGLGADSGTTTVRTVRQALRFLRNKWTLVASVLSVYKENDATVSWNAVVTTDGAADPVTGSDPAG